MLRAVLFFLLLVVGIASTVADLPGQERDADFARGVKDLEQKNWQDAISSFRNSLKSHPRRADTFFYISQAYYLNGEMASALAAIAEAARLDPGSGATKQKHGEYLCEAGRCLKGLDLLLGARRLDPKLEHIDFDVGMAYYRLSNLEEATRNLEVAIRREPANGEIALFLAECYSLRVDWPQAEKMYRQALAAGKQDASTYYGLGRALLRQGEPEGALARFEKALEMNPSLVECHFLMARALRSLGRKQEAEQQLKISQAIHEATDVPTALSRQGDPDQEAFWAGCQRLLEQHKEHEVLERLHSVNGGRHPYYLLGALYYNMGRLDEAQRVLKVAVLKDPRDADALAWLGRTELAKGSLAEAETSFRRVLEMDTENQEGVAGIGTVRHAQQRWGESAEWIERSKTRDPATLLDLCDDYLKLGRRDDAELAAALVQNFGAGDKTVQSALDKLMRSH